MRAAARSGADFAVGSLVSRSDIRVDSFALPTPRPIRGGNTREHGPGGSTTMTPKKAPAATPQAATGKRSKRQHSTRTHQGNQGPTLGSARMRQTDDKPAQAERGPREAASHVDDNLIVELAWNYDLKREDFIVFDRTTGKVSRCVEVDTVSGPIMPPAGLRGIVTPDGEIGGMVLLPTASDRSAVDTMKLWIAVRAFINRYVQLPGEAMEVAVAFVFLSWVHDRFDEVPYVAFRTPERGKGKSRALETVGTLCYRPILCGGGSTAAAVLRLVDSLGGTLIADEFDQKHHTDLAAALTQILNQGFQRNRPIVKCVGDENRPKPFRCFGPKMFAFRLGFADDATESRTLSIRMRQRTRRDIPLNPPRRQFNNEALALRNKLLAWRFANFGKVKLNPGLADPRLEDRLNQIGLPLLAVAPGQSTTSIIRMALRDMQRRIASDRLDTLAGEVWQSIVEMAKPGQIVRPGEVADRVNKRRGNSSGGRWAVGSEKVGRVLLHDLELERTRDAQGTCYRLTEERLAELRCRFDGVATETATTATTARRRRRTVRQR